MVSATAGQPPELGNRGTGAQGQPVKKNHLTIIFMRDTNRPKTLELPVKLIALLVSVLVVSIGSYAFFMQGYYTLQQDNSHLETLVRSLKIEVGKLQNTIVKLSIRDSLAETESTGVAPAGSVLPEPGPVAPQPVANQPVANQPVEVGGLNLSLNRQQEVLTYSFLLEKVVEEPYTIRGYVFVALKNSRRRQVLHSYPEAAFHEGLPDNYRLGDRFNIKRFKEYEGKLRYSADADSLEVLVYSEMGQLLVRTSRSAEDI